MKVLGTIIFSVFVMLGFSQNPADKLNFGKSSIDKKSGEISVVIPKKSNWKPYSWEGTNSLPSNAKIHYSRVFQGDTTSVSIDGEYIEFRENPYSDSKPVVFYSPIVTNSDWLLYQNYVKDSIARKFLGQEFREKYFQEIEVEEDYQNSMSPYDYPLNWGSKINWKKENGNMDFSMLIELFYPEHEQFYRKLEIDSRKMNYSYHWSEYQKCEKLTEFNIDNILEQLDAIRNTDCSRFIHREIAPLFRDSTLWVKDTSLTYFDNIEDGLAKFYNSDKYYYNYPVTGISAPQAKGYLHWLEKHHQQKLDASGNRMKVIYTLPNSTIPDNQKIKNVVVSSFELTSWQISNADYKEFIDYVEDSIKRAILFEELGRKGGFRRVRYDFEYEEMDIADWNLNYQTKIKQEHAKYLRDRYYSKYEGDTNLIDKRKLFVRQYYYDFKTAAIEVKRIPTKKEDYTYWNGLTFIHKVKLKRYTSEVCFRGVHEGKLGKNLDISYIDDLGRASDVIAHEDRSRFIIEDILNVYPDILWREVNDDCLINGDCYSWMSSTDSIKLCQLVDCEMCPQNFNIEDVVPQEYDFKSSPKALITSLAYYQYVAYWRWRIRKGNFAVKNENPVISNYIPSKEEFSKIQKGELVIHAKEVHKLPTPSFRYLVKFYKK